MADETHDGETAVPASQVIDLSAVRTAEELHRLLQRELGFPDFYGRNWNAFWDAITGLVDLPHELTFTGWPAFSTALPAEARRLRTLLDDYLGEFGQYLAVPRRVHYR